jgi:hypothetical protein
MEKAAAEVKVPVNRLMATPRCPPHRQITRSELERKWTHHVALFGQEGVGPHGQGTRTQGCASLPAATLTCSLRPDDLRFAVFCCVKPDDAEAFAERFGVAMGNRQ